MKDFRQLKVWEKSHALTLTIYKATEKFPNTNLIEVRKMLNAFLQTLRASR